LYKTRTVEANKPMTSNRPIEIRSSSFLIIGMK
jgi:hypothetical protein